MSQHAFEVFLINSNAILMTLPELSSKQTKFFSPTFFFVVQIEKFPTLNNIADF